MYKWNNFEINVYEHQAVVTCLIHHEVFVYKFNLGRIDKRCRMCQCLSSYKVPLENIIIDKFKNKDFSKKYD